MVALLADYEGCAKWSVGKRTMRRHALLCEVVSMTRTSDIAARGAGDEAQVLGVRSVSAVVPQIDHRVSERL
jgi:hypothetical protein